MIRWLFTSQPGDGQVCRDRMTGVSPRLPRSYNMPMIAAVVDRIWEVVPRKLRDTVPRQLSARREEREQSLLVERRRRRHDIG